MSFAWSTGRYYWDFSDKGLADVSALGITGASIVQQSDGISLIQTAASDIKAQLLEQRACCYNATITMECTNVGGAGNIGICFRTTSFNSSNDSYAWYFGISAGGWTLGTGSNSTYASWTQRSSGTGTYTGRHILKVILNGATATCYIDGVLVCTYTISSYYYFYGYIIPRAYAGDSTDRIHNLEILSTSIPDPTTKNINRFVKVVFDRDVHFPYADMTNYALAFTATFQQRDFYNEALYQKTITAINIKHAKDSSGNDILNTIIVMFTLANNFRKAEGDVLLHFDSSKCLIYGRYIKDKLANFDMTFTPANIDRYQNPKAIEPLRLAPAVANNLVSIPLWTYIETEKTSAVYMTVATANNIVPTLTGTIKP